MGSGLRPPLRTNTRAHTARPRTTNPTACPLHYRPFYYLPPYYCPPTATLAARSPIRNSSPHLFDRPPGSIRSAHKVLIQRAKSRCECQLIIFTELLSSLSFVPTLYKPTSLTVLHTVTLIVRTHLCLPSASHCPLHSLPQRYTIHKSQSVCSVCCGSVFISCLLWFRVYISFSSPYSLLYNFKAIRTHVTLCESAELCSTIGTHAAHPHTKHTPTSSPNTSSRSRS